MYMPLPESPNEELKQDLDSKLDSEKKKDEEAIFDEAQKNRWNFYGDFGLSSKPGDTSLLDVKEYSVGDFLPDPYDQAMANMKLQNIMNNEVVDYDEISMKEKKVILLLMGGRALADYDVKRKNSSKNAHSITWEEFKKNYINGLEADVFIAKAQRPNRHGEWLVTVETKEDLFDDLSELLDVPASEIEKIWDVCDDDDDFRKRLHDKYFKAGVCRDIAVFQAKLAHDMGLEDVFSSSVSNKGGPHVVMGFRDENGNISFIDYGGLIETDTPNMKLALSVVERAQGSIALSYLQSEGKEKGDNIILIKSKAAEVLEDLARGTKGTVEDEMSESMDRDRLEAPSNSLGFSINNERSNIELDLETIAGSTIISSTVYYLSNDGTTSIDTAYSARVAQEYGGKHFRGGVSGAFAHIKMKPLVAGVNEKAELNKFLLSLYGKMHEEVRLGNYFKYRMAAMVDVILDVGLDEGTAASYQAEFGSEHRLYLVTPSLDLYVGAKNVHSVVPSNLKITPTKVSDFAIVNNLLAANVGVDVRLGQWSGYKVNFDAQGGVGAQYLGKAMEYTGRAGVDVGVGKKTVTLDVRGKYVDSKDFRINGEGQIEGSIGYTAPLSKGVLNFRGYAFDSKSLGVFKDKRLDQWGAGFDVSYLF